MKDSAPVCYDPFHWDLRFLPIGFPVVSGAFVVEFFGELGGQVWNFVSFLVRFL